MREPRRLSLGLMTALLLTPSAIVAWVKLGPVFPTNSNNVAFEWIAPSGIAETSVTQLPVIPDRCSFSTERSAETQRSGLTSGLWRVNISIDSDPLTTQVFRVA